jgi:cytochrome d ubiquinol oxidase subunit II
MSLELIVAGFLLLSLTCYVLTGGADYGAGVWYLLAIGPRSQGHRALIHQALAPIWEVNHVWLILILVILFTAFPVAFAAIMTALHIPLTVLLLGIVLRGAAFVFTGYGKGSGRSSGPWDVGFAAASLLAPFLLGVTIGAISSGAFNTAPVFAERFLHPWLQPFPLAVGAFTVALVAYLAAVYLILEARDEAIQEAFRRRAIVAGLVVGGLEELVLLLARTGAPLIWDHLTHNQWGLGAQGVTAMTGIAVIWFLWQKQYRHARVCAVGQVIVTIWTWALALFPHLVPPDLTIFNTAAPTATLQALVVALIAGVLLLFPALYYLLRVFKKPAVFGENPSKPPTDGDVGSNFNEAFHDQ